MTPDPTRARVPPVWIVGGIPAPIGGITSFLLSLIRAHPAVVAGLVDLYPGEKVEAPVTGQVAPWPGRLKYAWLIWMLIRLRRHPLFINMSTTRSLPFYSLALLGRSAPTYLVLHHGNLESGITSGKWGRALTRWLLKPFWRIGCLSRRQHDFFVGVGIRSDRLVMIEPAVKPPPDPTPTAHAPLLASCLQWIKSGDTPLIIGSGYAESYYNHNWGLRALDSPVLAGQARYLLCCYGPDTEHLAELRAQFAGRTDARLVYGLGPDEFSTLLRAGSVYIRPSEVDSFGLATVEARDAGLTVIASDACDRAPGVTTFPAGDFVAFLAKLERSGLVRGVKIDENRDKAITRVAIHTFLALRPSSQTRGS